VWTELKRLGEKEDFIHMNSAMGTQVEKRIWGNGGK
jgi:hypothetical protein